MGGITVGSYPAFLKKHDSVRRADRTVHSKNGLLAKSGIRILDGFRMHRVGVNDQEIGTSVKAGLYIVVKGRSGRGYGNLHEGPLLLDSTCSGRARSGGAGVISLTTLSNSES